MDSRLRGNDILAGRSGDHNKLRHLLFPTQDSALAGWADADEGRRLSDRARHRLPNRCQASCLGVTHRHATIRHYEAREGVSATLVRISPLRDHAATAPRPHHDRTNFFRQTESKTTTPPFGHPSLAGGELERDQDGGWRFMRQRHVMDARIQPEKGLCAASTI